MHLYFHVPFCARRCSYCDFAIAVRREIPSRRYADAVLAEWRGAEQDEIWSLSGVVQTIYFGGGTPSLLEPDDLGQILAAVRAARPIAADAELTLEANPDDVTPERAAKWARLGLNRVSLGVQSFEPQVLEWMHRTHRAEQAEGAVRVLRAAGINDVSLDLIFGLPPELGRDWVRDVELAIALMPSHLSFYGLTIEAHTPLARWVERGEALTGTDERYAEEFLFADRRLGEAGFEHYEVSNYGLPGKEARHNSAYWVRAPFLGLGPSAHSGWGRHRRWNRREYAAWLEALESGETPVSGGEALDDEAERLEQLYLGLRTARGVDATLIPGADRTAWDRAGWLAPSPADRVVLSPEGWLRLDSLVGHLQMGTRSS